VAFLMMLRIALAWKYLVDDGGATGALLSFKKAVDSTEVGTYFLYDASFPLT
jgi:hypothetical protein